MSSSSKIWFSIGPTWCRTINTCPYGENDAAKTNSPGCRKSNYEKKSTNDCSVGPCSRAAGNQSRDRNTGLRRVEPGSEHDYGAQTSPDVRPNGPKLSAAITTVRQYGQEHGRARGTS